MEEKRHLDLTTNDSSTRSSHLGGFCLSSPSFRDSRCDHNFIFREGHHVVHHVRRGAVVSSGSRDEECHTCFLFWWVRECLHAANCCTPPRPILLSFKSDDACDGDDVAVVPSGGGVGGSAAHSRPSQASQIGRGLRREKSTTINKTSTYEFEESPQSGRRHRST